MRRFLRGCWWLCYLFDRFQWYRRLAGGHWELWYVDFPVCCLMWHAEDTCSYASGHRPALCRGTAICEDYQS